MVVVALDHVVVRVVYQGVEFQSPFWETHFPGFLSARFGFQASLGHKAVPQNPCRARAKNPVLQKRFPRTSATVGFIQHRQRATEAARPAAPTGRPEKLRNPI